MAAGAGIVHSERTPAEQRAMGPRLFGIQAWAALPKSHEERAPTFAHYDAAQLPRISGDGKTVRLVMGAAVRSRRRLQSFRTPASMPKPCWRRAPCCRSTRTTTSGRSTSSPARSTSPAKPSAAAGCSCSSRATASPCWRPSQARLILLGGEPMDGPRHIWWNFVSSSKDRDRRRQGRLEGQALRRRPRRRRGVHPASRRPVGLKPQTPRR